MVIAEQKLMKAGRRSPTQEELFGSDRVGQQSSQAASKKILEEKKQAPRQRWTRGDEQLVRVHNGRRVGRQMFWALVDEKLRH
jgi:hypothetical protein